MLNILIISDEAKEIYALFKSAGFAPDTQDLTKDSASPPAPGSPGADNYDVAFLDLDTEHWQQRLLDVRHRMPVIAFSRAAIGKAVEAMKLGASDYLENPLPAEALSDVLARHKRKILTEKYGFDEII